MTSTLPQSVAPPRRFGALQHWGLLLVALLAAWVFFYKLGEAQLTDWDEAWHAQVSSEILSSGDWITLHYRGQPYFNKPPLTFWLRAVAFRIGGVNETSARFWSALFGWGTVLAVAWAFGRIFDRAIGTLAGLILCTSWLFCLHHAGRSGEADSALIFFGVMSYIALWQARSNIRWFYAAGILTGLAWLAKGSIAYLPWLAAIIALLVERPKTPRLWRHLIGGFALAVLLTLPWQAAMLARHGSVFARMFYLNEGLLPAIGAVEDHPGGVRFYPLILHAFFQPWLSLAGAAAIWALFRLAPRRTPTPALPRSTGGGSNSHLLWLITWALTTLLAAVLFSTKMTWYATPALPALAVLAALAGAELSRRRWGWAALAGAGAFGVLQVLHEFFEVPFPGRFGDYWSRLNIIAAGAIAIASGLMLMRPASSAHRWRTALALLCLAAPLVIHLYGVVKEITAGHRAPEWLDLDMRDEPWREVCDRIARDHPGRPILLVDILPNPAAYFYLHRLKFLGAFDTIARKIVAERLHRSGEPTIVVRAEEVDALKPLGLEEEFRDGALVVMRKRGEE